MPEWDQAAAEAQMAESAAALAAGFRDVFPRVVERQVRTIITAWGRLDDEGARRVRDEARAAGREAGMTLADSWAAEAAKPVREQRHGPLEFLRSLRAWPTEVLARAGVPPVMRDAFSVDRFPDDIYGLMIERFIDLPGRLGEALHAHHITWGAAKAMWAKAGGSRA